MTVETPDLYGGAAITTKNIYKKTGGSWTEVAGAGTFNADAGNKLDIVFGIGDAANEDDAQPFGKEISWTVPCESYPRVSAGSFSCDKSNKCGVIDDSLATDLTVVFFDPNDGNTITSSDRVDMDAGKIYNVKVRWTGSFEEDFGNRFCEDFEQAKNAIVIRYNTTEYDDVYVTDLQGNRYTPYSVQINRLLSASSGFTDAVFEFPVLRSNYDEEAYIVFDTDDSVGPDGGVANVTVYLYDVNYYLDNDLTPAEPKCGIMDEDGSEVGAAAADSGSIFVEDD